MRVLVLGASGMIGSAMLQTLCSSNDWEVIGSVRAPMAPASLGGERTHWVCGVDLTSTDHMARLFQEAKPDVVVNCAGLTKHLPGGNDPIPALTLNALLPHRLAMLCGLAGARLIHVSTDCVFSGKKGNYSENEQPDALDVYGKTKHMGEVAGPGLVTLRTSTIGHERGSRFGLLEWFLAQQQCKGYRKAIFSGLPTLEFARVVRDLVIPNTTLEGLYHVGAEAIDKDTLLRLIAKVYHKQVEIETDDLVNIDRSLDSTRFTDATGYRAPAWPDLIEAMHQGRPKENQ
ncbi:dTDP-4-dehydrorhamnose reductase family protein [Leeia sp.]|uniref:dTDP-4-dehydrorhamnose reductase family protein n=1 Tax=Leeia sp. TaxID=2884678 RepID=UPI0035B21A9E